MSWAPLAPFDPARWRRVRRMDRFAFMLRHGLPAGLAMAAVVDSLALWIGGDGDLLLSPWRLPRLVFTLASLGPLLGAACAQLAWVRGENAYANYLLKEAFRAEPPALPDAGGGGAGEGR